MARHKSMTDAETRPRLRTDGIEVMPMAFHSRQAAVRWVAHVAQQCTPEARAELLALIGRLAG